eukprot:753583-Hanusia_phi.AAC.2
MCSGGESCMVPSPLCLLHHPHVLTCLTGQNASPVARSHLQHQLLLPPSSPSRFAPLLHPPSVLSPVEYPEAGLACIFSTPSCTKDTNCKACDLLLPKNLGSKQKRQARQLVEEDEMARGMLASVGGSRRRRIGDA